MTDATSLPPPPQQDQRLWFELKTLTELLDERGDELSAMEIDGVLKLPVIAPTVEDWRRWVAEGRP